MKFTFGNIVAVDGDQIGVVVKCWQDETYEVYVRSYNGIREYKESDIEHYIYDKEILDSD